MRYFRVEILEKLIQQQKPALIPCYAADKHQKPIEQEVQSKEIRLEKTLKTIRFITTVPKFVGEEMEIYGPYQENETASLPTKIADILIKKGRAEETHDTEKQQQTVADEDQQLVS